MKIEFFEELIPPKTTAQQKGRRSYSPSKVALAAATWKAIARRHKPERPLQGPLAMELGITFPLTAKLASQETFCAPKETKPDLDNIAKAILDALEDEGFFSIGDQQIFDLHLKKWNGSIPGISITIKEL